MRKISKPPQAPGAVFLLCVSGVPAPDLKRRLTSVKTDIETAAAAYDLAAANGTLHTLPVSVGVAATVTKDEMSALYTVKMAKANSPGRPVYDKLMLLAPRGVCPLCGANKASTLDHHLPKALFSPLAVAPSNLIPACRDCNTTKRTSRPSTAGEQTFHPYFDDFGTERWLYASVIESSPPAVRFFVQPPAGWPQVQAERTQSHFDAFLLGRTYSTLAAQELVNMRYRLMSLYERAKEQGVRDHLTEEAVSKEVADRNSWQTALYRALSQSDWFCTEGFAEIQI